MLCPARFLVVAEDSGDEFACYIRTEAPKPQILVRSNIRSRRLKVGATDECVSNNPEDLFFWLDEFIDKSEAIEHAKMINSSLSVLPPTPNHPIPDGLPGTIANESIRNNQKESFAEPIEAIDVQVIDSNDPANDTLEDMLDVIPMHRSSIDDYRFPAPDQ